jgi:precorrin-3B methylase
MVGKATKWDMALQMQKLAVEISRKFRNLAIVTIGDNNIYGFY